MKVGSNPFSAVLQRFQESGKSNPEPKIKFDTNNFFAKVKSQITKGEIDLSSLSPEFEAVIKEYQRLSGNKQGLPDKFKEFLQILKGHPKYKEYYYAITLTKNKIQPSQQELKKQVPVFSLKNDIAPNVNPIHFPNQKSHPMRMLGSSGVWEIFIPGLGANELYKFHIKTKHGYFVDKTDPMAFYMELRPRTGSRTWKINNYQWNDQEWQKKKINTNWHQSPVSIYEIHLSSWKRKAPLEEDENAVLSYLEYAEQLIPYLKKMGYTHVELMPITEFPFDGSWGYQVSGYYAPTSRFGTPDEFKYLIDQLHQHDIGVILDWVPAHFPKDAFSLAKFDGTAVYEHSNPIQGEHPHWGTLIFNYGRTEVQSFLTSNAFYWIKEFHLDGLRVDAVSSMIHLNYGREETGDWLPNEHGSFENIAAIRFLQQLNKTIHAECPGVMMIAEEATAWPCVSKPLEFHEHALGFDFKWNMGWMHDTLKYFKQDPLFRKGVHDQITFSMAYYYNENFILPFSHDEVVHLKGSLLNKMHGDYIHKLANLKLLYAYQFAHPGKKLLFMGSELAQGSEWNYKTSLDWFNLDHNGPQHIQQLIADLNQLYRREKALWQNDYQTSGFQWIKADDRDHSIYTFARKADNEHIICVLNCTPVTRYEYIIGCPSDGVYQEILNTDSAYYGGTNAGNQGSITGRWIARDNQPYSLSLTIPPLGAIYLKSSTEV
jgi:1,4-alpha-glucan branching enzyme